MNKQKQMNNVYEQKQTPKNVETKLNRLVTKNK